MPGPHDAFFKVVFAEPAHAEGVIRAVLPGDVVTGLDFATLRRVPGTFIDDALSERQSDVLFVVDSIDGRPVLVYVLLEHQSTDDPLMPLRVLRYLVRIWDAHIAEHGASLPLPPIVPVVVTHAAGGWQTAPAFESLVALDGPRGALAPFVPRFRFALDDLVRVTDSELLRRTMTAVARVGLLALKHAHDDVHGTFEGLLDLLREVARSPDRERAFMALLRYILLVTGDTERTIRLAAKIDEGVRAMAMTSGERLRIEGAGAILIHQLGRRFGPLPAEIVTRVESASIEQLTRWADRVLDAATLDDVFAEH